MNLCRKCEHNDICDWWIVCMGDCAVCQEHDDKVQTQPEKIKSWCGGNCENKRFFERMKERIK